MTVAQFLVGIIFKVIASFVMAYLFLLLVRVIAEPIPPKPRSIEFLILDEPRLRLHAFVSRLLRRQLPGWTSWIWIGIALLSIQVLADHLARWAR
ncbi:MAG: hypothetical protein NTU53_23135 [Planctomycetota bacterium]|nr:hypothetical protein [Planctomycetota bacterium]